MKTPTVPEYFGATPERLAKLPQWARDVIEWQTRTIKELAEHTTELEDAVEPSPIYYGGRHDDTGRVYIPAKETITFELQDGSTIEFRFRDGAKLMNAPTTFDGVDVMASGPYAPNLAVVPRSSNVVRLLTLRER